MENRADVGQRFAGPSAGGDDEIFSGGPKLDCLYLVAVELVAFENVPKVRVKRSFGGQIVQTAEHLERWVELQKGLRPELTFPQFVLDFRPNRIIRNLEEATDVCRVVVNDLGVRLKDIHGALDIRKM